MQRDLTDKTVNKPTADAASVNASSEETAPPISATTPDSDKLPFAPPSEPEEVGRLGKYRIQRELGRGGMGAVFLAFDERLQRKVALKVMLPKAAANATAKDRFLREARAAAQISSDHVVHIYEADEIDGVPFIALQYLQGYPLDEYLKKKGTPSLPQVIRLGRETALGLAAAHKLGMVHRDIKPGNIWLEAPGGRVKILDFGLAKPVVNREQHELTASGAVVGTPAYMAPEQGMGQNVDGRADLFSLGCMLYRLVCGRLPFEGPTLMAILTAIATQEPPPVRELNPAVPEPLANLIHCLLSKDPVHRPATAMEVAKELEAMSSAAKKSAAEVTTSLPTAPQPQVVYLPVRPVSVRENNPFEQLYNEEVTGESEPKTSPKRGKASRWPIIAVAVFGVLLLAGVGGFIIIKITNKDGTVTEIKVPEGSKIEVNGNTVITEPKVEVTKTKPEPSKEAPVSISAPTLPTPLASSDRAVAEWVLSNGGQIEARGLVYQSLPLPSGDIVVSRIDLTSKTVEDADLARLSGLKYIERLNLGFSPKVTANGLKHLSGLHSLRELSVPSITPGGEFVEPLLSLAKLEYLELPSGVSDVDLERLVKLKKLQRLIARFSALTDDGLKHLLQLPELVAITLDRSPRISDRGAAVLAGMPRLKEVDLEKTRVGEDGWRELAKLPALEIVHANTPYTEETLKALATVQTLQFIGGYTDGVYLSCLKGHANLRHLWVSNLAVGDESIPTIVSLKKLTNLNVTKCGISAAGFEKLKAALPNCRIVSDYGTYEPK